MGMRLNTLWREQYPLVMRAIGVIIELLPKLVKEAHAVPLEVSIPINATILRTSCAMMAAVREKMFAELKTAPWGNPELTEKIIDRVARRVWNKTESAVREAEKNLSPMQSLLRKNAFSNLEIVA